MDGRPIDVLRSDKGPQRNLCGNKVQGSRLSLFRLPWEKFVLETGPQLHTYRHTYNHIDRDNTVKQKQIHPWCVHPVKGTVTYLTFL